VEWLRREKRIVGAMVGSLPGHPSQNTQLSLPLVLLPEEVTWCLECGWIRLLQVPHGHGEVDGSSDPSSWPKALWSFPHTEEEKQRYLVFKELYARGHYITSGLLFGGDFAAYPGDPLQFHAEMIVAVRPYREEVSPLALVSLARLAVGVKKSAVLASVHPNTQTVLLLELTWRGTT
jgi:tRNA-splicing endonuclease subunit Sen34